MMSLERQEISGPAGQDPLGDSRLAAQGVERDEAAVPVAGVQPFGTGGDLVRGPATAR